MIKTIVAGTIAFVIAVMAFTWSTISIGKGAMLAVSPEFMDIGEKLFNILIGMVTGFAASKFKKEKT